MHRLKKCSFLMTYTLCCFGFFGTISMITGCGNSSNRAAQRTQPLIKEDGNKHNLDIDRGSIYVHPTIMKEFKADGERVKFGDLLKAEKVFADIKATRTADILDQKSLQQLYKVAINYSGTPTTSENTSEYNPENVLNQKLSLPTTRAEGLSSPYHELLYATANSILGGQSIQNLYNFKDIPKDFKLYVIPTVVSFKPGRITSENYIAKATLTFQKFGTGTETTSGKKDLDPGNFRIIAVAPTGFTRLVSETISKLKQTQLNLALAAQYQGITGSGNYQAISEKLDHLAHVLQKPDFNVSITNYNSVEFTYNGIEGFQGKTNLSDSIYDAEIIVISDLKPQSPVQSDNAPTSGQMTESQNGTPSSRVQIFVAQDLRQTSQEPRSPEPRTQYISYKYEWHFEPAYKVKSPWYSAETKFEWDKQKNDCYGSTTTGLLPNYYIEEKSIIKIEKVEVFAKPINKVKLTGENLDSPSPIKLELNIYDKNGICTSNSENDERGSRYWVRKLDNEISPETEYLTIELAAKTASKVVDHVIIKSLLKPEQKPVDLKINEKSVNVNGIITPDHLAIYVKFETDVDASPKFRKNDEYVIPKAIQTKEEVKNDNTGTPVKTYVKEAWLENRMVVISEKDRTVDKQFILSIEDANGKIKYINTHVAKW